MKLTDEQKILYGLIPQSVQAKKSFSQNWLVNSSAQIKITDEVKKLLTIYPDRKLVEIGPGQGHLTKHLVDLETDLTLIELENEANEYLRLQEWMVNSKAKLIEADALELLKNNDEMFKNCIIYSSLPYSTGSRMMVELGQNFPDTPFCVILQREVAQKTQLKKGKLTFFGAYLNLFWDFKIAFNLSKGNFNPAPKVTSSVLIGKPKISLVDAPEKILRKYLHGLLADSKKTLVNNLKKMNFTKDEIEQFFTSNNLDVTTRLTANNYIPILQKLIQLKPNL